jgi:hypothetical protein
MTELIIIEELDYCKAGGQQDTVQPLKKEPYKALLSDPVVFQRWMRCYEKIKVSDEEFLEDFPLQAEFTALNEGIDDDVPIAFYKRDECFTRKAFEERNYICTIEPHERAHRLNFSEEIKLKQKERNQENINKVTYARTEYNSSFHRYRRSRIALDSRVDFTIDPHDYCKITDHAERDKQYNIVKIYWAHVGYHDIPPFDELYALIQRHKWSLDSWWNSEMRYGKSKAACIHHIAKHFGDYSLWEIMESHSKRNNLFESWLKVHGYIVKM